MAKKRAVVSSIMFAACLGWFLFFGGQYLKADSDACSSALRNVVQEDGTVMCSDCALLAYSASCCGSVDSTEDFDCELDPNTCSFHCVYLAM